MGGTARVACLQMRSEVGRKSQNRSHLADLIEEAASGGARIVVAPEMALCGYVHSTPKAVMSEAEPVPGPATVFVSDLARRLGVSVSFGMAERGPTPGVCYNSSVLIGADGALVQCYRKSHLAVEDTTWAVPGDRILPVKTALGKIGTLICADVGFAETVRLLALEGCGIVLFPMAWAGRSLPADVYFRARAVENGCYLVVSDVVGEQGGLVFHGNSMVVAPDGSIVAQAQEDREEVIYADLDQDETAKRSNEALDRRRPEMYAGVLRKSFFWQQSSFLNLPKSRSGYLAAGRYAPKLGDLENDIALAEETVRAAAPDDGRPCVTVLPPYSLSGCPVGADEAISVADLAWDPLCGLLAKMAASTGSHVVGSGVEKSGTAMYHTAVLASPNGAFSFYRGTHLCAAERTWASEGDRLRSFDVNHARLGIMLGDEMMVPEISRCLSKDGVDIQCSLCQPDVHWAAPQYIAQERATTSGCYVVVSSGSEDHPAMISGNLDARLGETQNFLSSLEGRLVRMAHETFDGSWVRNRVRLGRTMEHLYGPLLTAGHRRNGREEQ